MDLTNFMNTPSPNTPQAQDPDVLKARLTALDAQLTALDAQRDAQLATANSNYVQQKSNLTRQKNAAQEQIVKLTTPATT